MGASRYGVRARDEWGGKNGGRGSCGGPRRFRGLCAESLAAGRRPGRGAPRARGAAHSIDGAYRAANCGSANDLA